MIRMSKVIVTKRRDDDKVIMERGSKTIKMRRI